MSYQFDSRLGEQLYRLLPEVYRTRDRQGQSGNDGELAAYLDAHGRLFDLIHATLEQQLRDGLPETSQEWLLPYFARLLGVDIVSPGVAGKRAEIGEAIAWRQRKGTLACAEQIAQSVGEMEVELQEGWRRLAMTPRIGMPLVPARASDADSTLGLDMDYPPAATRHPAMPVAMVDLRRCSRAVQADINNPAAHSSGFGGIRQTWRQANVHGAPCFPGSFEDVSPRTVDVRTPVTPDRGLYHSKRLLAFAAPPGGLFPAAPLVESWADALQKGYVEESTTAGVTSYANATARTLVIKGDVNLAAGKPYHIDDIRFSGTLKLTSGQLQLGRVEAKKVQVDTFSTDRPVLTAAGCLFESLSVGAGPAQLDSCTVLDIATLVEVQAVDCIFMAWAATNPDLRGTFHHCRIPADDLPQADIQQCTRDDPKLFATAVNFDTAHNEPEYNGAGVLRPDSPATVYAGASDGGELGYFHGGRQDRPVRIEKPKSFTFVLPAAGGYPLEDVLFGGEITVSAGRLRLRRSAAKRVSIETGVLSDGGEFIPSLDAVDCLFEALDYPGNSKKGGLVRLEYCTVLGDAMCWHLQASDCIFAGDITGLEKVKNPSKGSPPPAVNCVRYSAVRYSILDNDTKTSLNLKEGRTNTNTWLAPLFQVFEFCLPQGGSEVRPAQFGEAGCGVLGLQTAAAIRFGAEDGGEMGAGHHLLYSLKAKAVLTKMQEFLPLGIEPVLIYDPRLLHLPPRSV